MSTHDYHWTFGEGCHIHFPGGGDPVSQPKLAPHTPPIPDDPDPFKTGEGCATFCDGNGDLLFYTDGRLLYDGATRKAVNTTANSLGGSSGSAHSAIIVPPAGGGVLYHLFAVHDWDAAPTGVGPVFHTAIEVSPQVKVASPTTQLPDANFKSSERLAAIPHANPGKYWVICMEGRTNVSGSRFLAMLVDSDAAPDVSKMSESVYLYPGSSGFCIKFSPDGSLIAVASKATIDFLNFDRATGKITAHSRITGLDTLSRAQVHKNNPINRPYGVEFSPNGKYLYFSDLYDGYVRRHTIGVSNGPDSPLASTHMIKQYAPKEDGANYPVGALQLAPNGKIYGTRPDSNCLLQIEHPDDATLPADAATVGFKDVATAAGGEQLVLQGYAALGLPTFTRIPDGPAVQIDRCKEVATRVDELLKGRRLINLMEPCEGRLEGPGCAPLRIPPLRPWVSISWGDSECDCIEGDDIEIMHLTVCNPYSNVTLSRLTVNELAVVDERGEPVRLLPDDSPCIQLVPIGPYCFDDIAPCTCVTREFMLRLRGAPGNRKYHILAKGICFDACFHGDEDACFTFDVCKD